MPESKNEKGKPPPVELDEEAEELALRQIKAESAKAIAEAERDTARAMFPETTVKRPEGKLDVSDKSGFVADLTAHAVLDEAAKWVVRQVPEDADIVVLVEDRNLLASDWTYIVVRDQLAGHTRTLRDALAHLRDLQTREDTAAQLPRTSEGLASARGGGRRALAPGPMMIGAAVGAAAEIVSLLRSDYALVGRQVTISTSALAAAVVGRLATRSSTTTALDGFALVEESGLLTELKQLRSSREEVLRAHVELEAIRIGPLRREIDDATTMIAELEKDRLKTAEDGKSTAAIDARLAELRVDRSRAEVRVHHCGRRAVL